MDAIQRSITIGAPIERVWACLTETDKIAAWLMPNTFAAEAGRAFTMDCPPGIGSGAPIQCVVMELRPPSDGRARLVYTWEIDEPLIETVLAIDLHEADGVTRLDLVHSGWGALRPEDIHILRRHEEGWDYLIANFLVPLATGRPPAA